MILKNKRYSIHRIDRIEEDMLFNRELDAFLRRIKKAYEAISDKVIFVSYYPNFDRAECYLVKDGKVNCLGIAKYELLFFLEDKYFWEYSNSKDPNDVNLFNKKLEEYMGCLNEGFSSSMSKVRYNG